jgi:hypothetical protein
MKRKLLGTVAIASLGAALAFAVPADARPFGQASSGHVSSGHVSAAPMARTGPSFSGSQMSSPKFSANNTARFTASNKNAHPGSNVTANNSFAQANPNWSGHNGNWSGRHRHHHRGGFGVGLALGAAPYYDDYDTYAYDDGYAPDEGYVYADEGYDTYAAAPEYTGMSVQACRQQFRSYDLATHTYLGFDGRRHSCP